MEIGDFIPQLPTQPSLAKQLHRSHQGHSSCQCPAWPSLLCLQFLVTMPSPCLFIPGVVMWPQGIALSLVVPRTLIPPL